MALYDCPNDAAVTAGLSTLTPGDIFDLYPGNTYVPFEIPSIANGDAVVFRAKNTTLTAGTRIGDAATLPIVSMTNANPNGPYMAGTGTVEYRGVEFRAAYASNPGGRSLVTLGKFQDYQTTVATLPANCALRHCIVNGNATGFIGRGLQWNGNGGTVHDSVVKDIYLTGSSQNFGINGTVHYGTLDVYNTSFTRCSNAILLGGGDTTLVYPVPPSLVMERCYVYWPTDWTADTLNHVEMKHWAYVRLVGNVFQNFWPDGQANVLNFSHYHQWEKYGVPGKTVTVAFNKFLNCAEKLIGINNNQGDVVPNPDGRMLGRGLAFRHNLCLVGRDPRDGTGSTNGTFLVYTPGALIEHNTILADQNISMIEYGAVQSEAGYAVGMRLNHNILPGGLTGNGIAILCSGSGTGQAGLDAMAGSGNWQCTGNAFGGANPGGANANPTSGNTFLANNAALASALTETYRIDPAGALAAYAGTMGADMDLVDAATSGVVAGTAGTARITSDSSLAGFSS